jgi:hypothetical protein
MMPIVHPNPVVLISSPAVRRHKSKKIFRNKRKIFSMNPG